jgi:hypothetical protein
VSDPLNFFEPYERLGAHHENQLTRAFLVVLRHSPMAHQAWLRLVDPTRQLQQLGQPRFRTQTGIVADGAARDSEERVPGISVIQAADVPVISGPVTDSARRAIYDGVITYGDGDLVIVVENKLDGPVSDRQVREINRREANIEFAQDACAVSWREVLEAFADLVDRELVGTAERALLNDFLRFCDEHFSALLPFSTLRRCLGDRQRVMRRFSALMASIAADPQDVVGHQLNLPGRATVDRAYLDFGGETRVGVWMFPAETLKQARQLWGDPERVARLAALPEQGWIIKPNMHFRDRGARLWSQGAASLDEYFRYWSQEIGDAHGLRREERQAAWDELVAAGIVDERHSEAFHAKFTNTNRLYAVPCPGLACGRMWPLADAADHDDDHAFRGIVVDAIDELLRALKEPTLTASVS